MRHADQDTLAPPGKEHPLQLFSRYGWCSSEYERERTINSTNRQQS